MPVKRVVGRRPYGMRVILPVRLEGSGRTSHLWAMDAVTQMLFGAVVAQAGFRRRLGRKAMVAGAALGLVPDLDVAVGWMAGPFANWVHHRGLTHSIFFAPMVGVLLYGILTARQKRRPPDRRMDANHIRSWTWLTVLVLATHPVIDLFTSYGTQLLAPFSRHRFAIDAMPIIDPVYSLALVVALVIGATAARRETLATTAAGAALFFVSAYTLFAWSLNDRVEREASAQLNGSRAAVTAYPTMFQPYLRRVVAETPEEVRVGFYSVLNPEQIRWQTFPREAHPPLVAATEEAEIFQWFAMNKVIWRSHENGNGERVVEALDYRYGLFGGSELGFWGIRAELDAAGRLLEDPRTFQNRPAADRDRLTQFWQAVVGP